MDYLTMDENVCPVCGKVFNTVSGREWGWSYKGSRYCSYHCMRHVETRHRVAMGWDKPPSGTAQKGSDEVLAVYKGLLKMRALARAYHILEDNLGGEDVALAAVTKRIGQLGRLAQARWAPQLETLDAAKRRLAWALFVEGRPVSEVALELDIDSDLVAVKVNRICEALAKEKV